MSTQKELEYLLNECGTKLSAMDAHLAKATEFMGTGEYGASQTQITAAHNLLADAGAALAAVAEAVLNPATPPVEPPVEPPVPPPNPDALARMRAAPSQLSMWQPATSPEVGAMNYYYGPERVAQQLAFYGPGMPGNVTTRQTGPGSYDFINGAQQWQADINGAGDAFVAANAAASGNPVIAPLSPPPA